jgi:hypothetical protein
MHERHAYRLIRDLFDHKEEIFGELKRASSQNHSLGAPPGPRPRAPSSTDESNRRANMEARNQAIVKNRARAPSPAPSPIINGRGHRRDRSSGAAERRFPIQTSPTANMDIHKRGMRHSLEVPDVTSALPHPVDANTAPAPASAAPVLPEAPAETSAANGTSDQAEPPPADPARISSISSLNELRENTHTSVEKKNSLGRSGHVAAAASRLNRKKESISGGGLGMIARHSLKRDSAGSLHEQAGAGQENDRRGVELSDKPMDY